MSRIGRTHLERRAYVYVRQSSLAQVHNHRESGARQYQLRERACALGWACERVEVIDEDQGQSGASSDGRGGFQRLVSEVALGQVGAVLGLEVSRLARSCADWYRLLEVAALSRTLIVDEDGVYDPNHYNDRLLLGLEGTMSEAELHFLKSRMMGGRRNKARRGAFHIRLPVGYVWEGEIRLDPDERVRQAIHLFFRCFERLGSAGGVARYFEDEGLLFPRRDGWGSPQVSPTWGPLSLSRAVAIVRSPLYAGTYAYARHCEHPEDPEDPAASGYILLPDAHPAYITQEQYERNVARLDSNQSYHRGVRTRGSVREGASLLHGIVLCGRCGRHMGVSYRPGGVASYWCRTTGTRRPCQEINGRHVEPLIEEVVLDALRPHELELAVGALEKFAESRRELERQWLGRLEAARYEADKAARRYHRVEPENRLVARTLEADWNARLEELEALEAQYAADRGRPPLELSEEQRDRLRALARDVPRLWRAATTRNGQRQEIVRLLIEDVTLEATDEPWRIKVGIRWRTGVATWHEAERVRHYPHTTPAETVERIFALTEEGRTDREISERLNAEGHRTGTGRTFTATRISALRQHRRRLQRAPETEPAVIARLAELYEQHTDQEVADKLNEEGLRSCTGAPFSSKMVFHLRQRHRLRKPGPRGLPRRPDAAAGERRES